MQPRHEQPTMAEQCARVMDCLRRDGRVTAEMLRCLGIAEPWRVVLRLRNSGELIRIVKNTDQAGETETVFYLDRWREIMVTL